MPADNESKHHKCGICSTAFANAAHLDRHVRTCAAETLRKLCNSGEKAVVLGSALSTRSRKLTGKKKYKCDLCSKTFSTRGSLKLHTRTIHNDEKLYTCNSCEQSFLHSYQLIMHLRSHTGEKPYKCNVCDKAFAQKIHLDLHLRTHTGEKPHKCSLCNRAFSQTSSLCTHMLTHTGEKPYKCDSCSKRFSRKFNLDIHLRTHTGEMPYKCKSCGKAFMYKYSLDDHTKLHIGERPYKCNFCDKSFIRANNMKCHTKIHNKVRPYSCKLCDKDYVRRNHLKEYVNNHNIGEKRLKCECILSDMKKRGQGITSNEVISKSVLPVKGAIQNSGQQIINRTSADKQLYENQSAVHEYYVNRFFSRPYGCGLCDEVFEIEREFMKHCCQLSHISQRNETFFGLFEGCPSGIEPNFYR